MRISSSMIHNSAATSILQAQSVLEKTQQQIASGVKVERPSDDPVAAVRIAALQQQQQANDQFGKNISAATNRLNLDEQSLSDATALIQRVRDLTVQGANTGALTAADRQSIVAEMKTSLQALIDIANRKDSNGDYLYAGLSAQTQPFVVNNSGVVQYAGDQASRLIQIGPTQRVADGHSGYEAFGNITEGNGTFYTAANIANTGSGVIDVGSVTNKTAWVPDNYTLTFTSATTYQITDSLTNVVTAGTYTPGSAITFNGVQVSVTGTPATNDTFSINRAARQDIFETFNTIISTLSQYGVNNTVNSYIATTVGNSLQQLDQALDHISVVRAEVGARLNTLETTESARLDSGNAIAKSLSDLRDVDYATALTKYNQQQVVLQAAQQSYAKISQLSLFNYL